MNSGSNVLEFRKIDDGNNNAYFSLASAMEINYFYQFCEYEMNSVGPNPFNLQVDLGTLEKNVKIMLTE